MSRIRRKNKKKHDAQGKLLIFLASIVLLTFAFGIYKLNAQHVQRDKVSMCREDGQVSQENVIIIDATDSFNKTQALLVKKELENVLSNSVIDERFSLYVINSKISDETPLVEVCNPGDGSSESDFTSNKRRLLKSWEEKFFQKIASQIDSLIGQNTANSSPIMETIKYSSVRSLYDSPADKKKIYIVSDLLQHSKNYSHYSQTADFTSFESGKIYNTVRPEINGVEIEILYLFRSKDSAKQNRQHIAFWEQFFSNSGGLLTRVKTIN